MSREKFREQVFSRDHYKCVFCDEAAVDAHHIMERRLWLDGGYHLDNGASVCSKHHILCETTDISVEQVREACGAKRIVPPHLYDDQIYDKWGNPCLADGRRLKGELFFDESVQKILKDKLNLFSNLVKYPRTYHLPWSENISDDDRVMKSLENFIGKEVVVTEKMDGENTTLYCDNIHARSMDGRSHYSRDWVKSFWSKISYNIPEGWRVCGENLWATHSIKYEALPSYFMGFSIWNEKNVCLSWDETLEWFQLLDIKPVPILFRGIYDEKIVRNIKTEWTSSEGYVIRVVDEIPYQKFKTFVGKCVRKGHIQTVKHWMYGGQVGQNGLE